MKNFRREQKQKSYSTKKDKRTIQYKKEKEFSIALNKSRDKKLDRREVRKECRAYI